MSRALKVYVAYRYSCDGKVVAILNSIGKVVKVGVDLERKGICAYVPHSDWIMAAVDGVDEPQIQLEQYYKHGIEWLMVCDAMLLLDPEDYGSSKGVTKEVDYCLDNGIPIFTSVEEVPQKIPSCFGAGPCDLHCGCECLEACKNYRAMKYK
jgi:hypothetical protein